MQQLSTICFSSVEGTREEKFLWLMLDELDGWAHMFIMTIPKSEMILDNDYSNGKISLLIDHKQYEHRIYFHSSFTLSLFCFVFSFFFFSLFSFLTIQSILLLLSLLYKTWKRQTDVLFQNRIFPSWMHWNALSASLKFWHLITYYKVQWFIESISKVKRKKSVRWLVS